MSIGLKKEILRNCPDLERVVKKDPLRGMVLIRDWLSNHVPWSVSEIELTRNCPDFFRKKPDKIYELFRSSAGGVLCGGLAHFGHLVYRLFGYDAAIYHYGLPGVFTHVVIAVTCREKGKTRLYLQDPAFNLHYIDSGTGEPLDLKGLLLRIIERNFESIGHESLPIHGRDYLVPVSYMEKPNYRMGGKSSKPDRLIDGVAVYKDHFSFERFLTTKTYSRKVRAVCGEENARHAFLRLFVYPVSRSVFKKKDHQKIFEEVMKTHAFQPRKAGDASPVRPEKTAAAGRTKSRKWGKDAPDRSGSEGTEAWLERTIFSDIPNLRRVIAKEPLKSMALIRNWTANRIPAAAENLQLGRLHPEMRTLTLPEMDRLFLSNRGGVMCGDAGHYCSELFRALGFDAATYNFGISGIMTHVVTLVADSDEFYVQDQTFNHQYIENAGKKQLPVKELLIKIQDGAVSGIKRDALPLDGRRYVALQADARRNYRKQHLLFSEDGVDVFRDTFSFENFFKFSARGPVLRAFFQDEDIGKCMLRLFERSISFGRFQNDALNEKLKSLFAGIPDAESSSFRRQP